MSALPECGRHECGANSEAHQEVRDANPRLGRARLAVSTAALGAGCETTTTSGGTTRYANSEYGFSFEITDRFEEGEAATGTGSSGDVAFSVIFIDPDGAVDGDTALDTFKTSVYELSQEITPELMADFQASLEASLAQLQEADATMVAEPLTETTVNGLPGWTDRLHEDGR